MNAPERVLRSSRVVTPEGIRDAAIRIQDGIIRAVVPPTYVPVGYPVIDVGDAVVMPGLIDCHVHINEPGRTEWEGFETATRAALAGGITTVVDMPLNSIPVTTNVRALQEKMKAAEGNCWVDCGFYGGLVPGHASEMAALMDAGAWGFKAFLIHSGIDDFPPVGESDLRAALPLLAERGVPLLVHAELAGDTPAGAGEAEQRRYGTYLASRPRTWENEAIRLLIDLCREYDCRLHIVHLSSADALDMIASARWEGLPLTVETCPHYLFFAAEDVPDGGTQYKCAPPIRERENRERLWRALGDGIIDFVVSDHSPCSPALKLLDTGDFLNAWGGIASLQLGLPVVWTQARDRGFGLADITRWLCYRPAKFLGLDDRKGTIAPGMDADLVVWDPDATFTARPDLLHHRHKLTPYEGQLLQGSVQMTFLRGTKVYDRGKFLLDPMGQLLKRRRDVTLEARRL